MARLLGPDAGSRLVYVLAGGRLGTAIGSVATVYSDAAGTVLADIATYDGTDTPGAVITGSTLTVDSDSMLPRFWLPDGVDTVYVKVGSGPVTPVNADYDARIDALANGGGNVPSTRRIDTTAPLTGGGTLAADRTLAVSGATTSSRGVVALAGDLAGTADAPTVPGLAGKLNLSGGTLTGTLTLSDGSVAASQQYVADHAGGGGGAGTATTLPLFNVEDVQYAGGAKGDGTTDDYAAIKAAWDAMVAAGAGYLFFPRRAVYRIDATGRLVQGTDRQYALFPIPDVPSSITSPKKIFGVLGVGEANVIRSWAGTGQDTAANVTASVLQVDHDAPFAWSATAGHPSVFGCKDGDIVGGFSNVHFRVEHLVIRQEPNPSLCGLNLECVSTAHIVDYYADVSGFLDEAPVPTNPTGVPLLLPKTGNAVQVKVDNVGAWGYYGGLPITEHGDVASAIVVRCRIGAFIRRTESAHMAHISNLAMEQCAWGLAGYDPTQADPDAVAPAPGWIIRIDQWDVEDFDAVTGMYTPVDGAHLYDPNNALKGGAWYGRVDSGAQHGPDDTAYVVGGSQFSLLKAKTLTTAVTKATGTAPGGGAGATTGSAADTFTRVDSATSLGTSSGGQEWTAAMGTWGIKSNAAYLATNGVESYNVAFLDAGGAYTTFQVALTPVGVSNAIDLGPAVLIQDKDNLVWWDISGTLGTTDGITTRLFQRSGGTFTGIVDATTTTLAAGTPVTLRMDIAADSISCYIDNTLIFASAAATGLEAQTKAGLIVATGSNDHSSTFDNLSVSSGG